ncbi:MobA-like NTP transferase domain-containing protein OS=Tsukamurella paurometabola (strain ATCC 8368/ DSM / CCUG 35730 / CIP 100753 / JCM 10117 / KCTC 9821/ NBRC 16120 / NCIMB 702349 / NCTC 13040) OX=521096 GN=Tpau_2964 PE=4 SV=1 [Tsukamurella paurometabola]|uniref:MobA-like NTP transferase domain-containing protein n=1 Tax=Tsukamurella paurometabola (strain ATCC 8368 / DSM 20162 / CCUG 35730 / CIP 100753 / JCM 10117 / KCTC 9821 / NBRC 16120 / NCIMB 702349 / NCTC 13040) TaxID=521096 RepID=D5UU57_TSUPD|nr:NTP transferase domain-containing protein [Tsukamurella paurometabola]ADG79560.1 conserved hypothetical protein [Tsukamurella paurometabola DSM 20162]SUP36238.1 molybdenum hydroxylase accessory protein, YgfJ family [Tsukamurella paurometabola]
MHDRQAGEDAGFRPTGVLLAAGAGSRFGMPKVRADGGRWADSAVRALRAGGCGSVLVVLGADPSARIAGARTVLAPDWQVGLSRSVAAGLTRADGAVVLMPVDTPDVNAECVRRVIAAGCCASSGIARAVYRGTVGHPVYVSAEHRRPLARALRAAGPLHADHGLGPHLPGATVRVECGDIATGRDIDRLAPGVGP